MKLISFENPFFTFDQIQLLLLPLPLLLPLHNPVVRRKSAYVFSIQFKLTNYA